MSNLILKLSDWAVLFSLFRKMIRKDEYRLQKDNISFIFQICSIFFHLQKINSTYFFPVAYIKAVVLHHVRAIFRSFTISVGSTNTVY